MRTVSNPNPSPSKLKLSRRSALKGAAWSLPVVAATTAAPLAASSANYDLRVYYEFNTATLVWPQVGLNYQENVLKLEVTNYGSTTFNDIFDVVITPSDSPPTVEIIDVVGNLDPFYTAPGWTFTPWSPGDDYLKFVYDGTVNPIPAGGVVGAYFIPKWATPFWPFAIPPEGWVAFLGSPYTTTVSPAVLTCGTYTTSYNPSITFV